MSALPDGEIAIGAEFQSRETLRKALALHHLQRDRDVRVSNSRGHVIQFRCRSKPCDFHLIARLRKPSQQRSANSTLSLWVVTELCDHSCPPQSGATGNLANANGLQVATKHRKIALTSDLMADSLVPLVMSDPGGSIKLYGGSLEAKFGPELKHASYHMVWRARKKAMAQAFGSDGYDKIESYCEAIVRADIDTVARVWKTPEQRYKGVYVASGPLIRLWRTNKIRQVVSLDATYTRGQHGGCILMLSCLDGGGRSLILAFAHVMGEDFDNWEWFLQHNLSNFPSLNRCDTVIFSDQQKGLLRAIREQFPMAVQCVCLFHRQLNLKATSGLTDKKGLLNTMKRCAMLHSKESCISLLATLPETSREFLLRVPLEQWTHSHCPSRRWGLTTTAFGESLNAVVAKFRTLPLLAQLKAILKKCHDLLSNTLSLYQTQVESGKTLSDSVVKSLERHSASGRIRLHVLSSYMNNGLPTGEVSDAAAPEMQFGVNLGDRTCTCGEYQQTGVPCEHAVAVARQLGVPSSRYVDPLLLLNTNLEAYKAALPIFPVSFEQLASSDLLPPEARRGPGRPRKRRIHSRGEDNREPASQPLEPSDSQGGQASKRQRVCRRCGRVGHYQKRCSIVQPDSAGVP